MLGPDLSTVTTGETGELAIAGSQLALGYLGAPDVTAARFPVIGGKRWYLTGDIAMQDTQGVFHHLGRIDNQVKIQGHRVELEDIEARARIVTGTDQVAAVAWPTQDGVARGKYHAAALNRPRSTCRSGGKRYMQKDSGLSTNLSPDITVSAAV